MWKSTKFEQYQTFKTTLYQTRQTKTKRSDGIGPPY